MPLQQVAMPAKDLPAQWRARLTGAGPFVHFGQTEVFVTSEAYGKDIEKSVVKRRSMVREIFSFLT